MSTEAPEGLLTARHLSKTYCQQRWLSRRRFRIVALDDVSLSLWPGRTLVLAGESGSGKSTLARCLARLEEPDSGEIRMEGNRVSGAGEGSLRIFRRRVQLLFQDAAASLNPRLTAAEIVAEPLRIQEGLGRGERAERARALMARVGLPPGWADRLPAEFSGGQRRRLALARALALEPRVVILDEGLTGLDLSAQAHIANLLLELQAALGLSYLLITHDLLIARHLADDVAILHQGRVVEAGPAAEVLSRPRHSQTQALLRSTPDWGGAPCFRRQEVASR